ncbi:hypothetical protein LTR66_003450 [Elasticomyces elasticus]|nr:hypothetical protein LTR50_005606 [Elasticomyces elasticus]KAK4997059.1 hypothetical protein LTR66_003450 [Elasticomyces elasticus]
MDMPVNVPVDDPNADTEWNDILRKHGIIPEKPPSPTPIIEEALTEARRLAHENRLEGKDLDELAGLEDEEDDAFLESYRNAAKRCSKKRLQELSTIQSSSIFNQVYHLQKPDYPREVTEASKKHFVLVLLTSSQGINTESRLLIEIWRELARKFGDVKFCQMQADMCIEGYPERNTPTILIYREGNIVKQMVTLKEMNGVRTTIEDLEDLLKAVGAIGSQDSRLRRPKERDDGATLPSSIRQGAQHRGQGDEESDENDSD